VVKAAQRGGRLQPVEKGTQLGVVRVVFGLRVDVPHQRRAGPQRAHQRILAAHEVHIARPQQFVVGALRQMG
jgi:hypothetical protein